MTQDLLLPITIWLQITIGRTRERAIDAWQRRDDETGMDEAVTKMIWLAVGIGVAVVATTFFIGVFNTAQGNVPDPAAPIP